MRRWKVWLLATAIAAVLTGATAPAASAHVCPPDRFILTGSCW